MSCYIKVIIGSGKHYSECLWCEKPLNKGQKMAIISCQAGNLKLCADCFKPFVTEVRLNLDEAITAFT
jgi:hypothetical protein